MATVSFVGLPKDALDTVYHLEKVISFVSNLSFHLFLNDFLVDDLKRKIKLINDVSLNDQIEGHVLTDSSDLFRDPFMQTPDCVTLQVFRLHLADRQVDVFNRTSFVLLLPLHFFFWYFQSDDEVSSLRSQNFIDMVKVKVLFGMVIAFKAKHKFSFLFNRVKHFVEGFHSLPDIVVPKGPILAKLPYQFDAVFEGQVLYHLRQHPEQV